jgi:hypothetical protein
MDNGWVPNPISEEELAMKRHIDLLGLDWTAACIRMGSTGRMPLSLQGGCGIGTPMEPGSDDSLEWIIRENQEGRDFIISPCLYPYPREFIGTGEPPSHDYLEVHIWIDGDVIGKDQVLEINEVQFRGSGHILRDGNHFWIWVVLPKIVSIERITKYPAKLHAYLLGLSKKWNIVHNDNLMLEIDTHSRWPWMAMPLAGTLDHFYNPPRRVKFIHRGSCHPWEWILSEVMKNPASIYQTETTSGMPLSQYMARYKSSMVSENSFSKISFQNYLSQRDRHRFRFFDKRPDRGAKGSLELVIFLRLNFHASTDVIREILWTGRSISGYGGHFIGSFQSHVDRLILTADRYIDRLMSVMNMEKDRMGRSFHRPSQSSIMMAEDKCPAFAAISDSLALKFGPLIHFAKDDIYVIRPMRGERQTVFLPSVDSKRKSFFVTIPCSVMANYDRSIQEKGVLLIPSQIAEGLISDLNLLPENGFALVYFWFYANKYSVISVPKTFQGSTSEQVDGAFSWARINYPDIFRHRRRHKLNRRMNQKRGRRPPDPEE